MRGLSSDIHTKLVLATGQAYKRGETIETIYREKERFLGDTDHRSGFRENHQQLLGCGGKSQEGERTHRGNWWWHGDARHPVMNTQSQRRPNVRKKTINCYFKHPYYSAVFARGGSRRANLIDCGYYLRIPSVRAQGPQSRTRMIRRKEETGRDTAIC